MFLLLASFGIHGKKQRFRCTFPTFEAFFIRETLRYSVFLIFGNKSRIQYFPNRDKHTYKTMFSGLSRIETMFPGLSIIETMFPGLSINETMFPGLSIMETTFPGLPLWKQCFLVYLALENMAGKQFSSSNIVCLGLIYAT